MDCNEALVKHGYTARIDARSLVDQGLDRLPMVHEA
ncbi:MAG: MobA/MobL family protein [Firmicutes bacterium]|nr:MobA/MobL family protein [Bacillota bacterium]